MKAMHIHDGIVHHHTDVTYLEVGYDKLSCTSTVWLHKDGHPTVACREVRQITFHDNGDITLATNPGDSE